MIKINFVAGKYIATASYDDREILKNSGFFWDQYLKKWYAPTPQTAYRLYSYCTPETQKQITHALSLETPSFQREKIKWPKNKVPYVHQIDGALFCLTRKNSYLAFEAGTGKTATAIMCINSKPGKTIIICPAFLKYNWQNELDQWLTHKCKIQLITSTKTEIDLNNDIFILPVSLLHVGPIRNKFFEDPNFKITWLIVDEAHYFKTLEAKRTQSLLGARVSHSHSSAKEVWKGFHKIADHTIDLSGTPMPNRPLELFPIVSKHAPHAIDFLDRHGYAVKYCNAHMGEWGWDYSGASNLNELNEKLTANFMSVKKLTECVDLPEKMPNHFLFLEDEPTKLQTLQMQILNRYSLTDLLRAESQNNDQLRGKIEARGGLSQVSEELLSYVSELRHLNGLKKVDASVKIIQEFAESGEHLLVFAWHNDVIEALAKKLKALKVFVITGKTPHKRRQEIVDEFQSSPTQCVLIANIQAAGVGITLTRAFRPIFVEPSWVPSDNEQAISRVHRIGQTQKVQATFLVWPNSIDYMILNAHQDKQTIINEVVKSKTQTKTKELPHGPKVI